MLKSQGMGYKRVPGFRVYVWLLCGMGVHKERNPSVPSIHCMPELSARLKMIIRFLQPSNFLTSWMRGRY